MSRIYNPPQFKGQSRYRGVWDASTGIPTSTAIKAGDFWRISVAGNIVNLIGQDLLTPGDVIVADVDGANTAAQFFGIQANTSLTLATILEEVTLATLPANTATDAIPVSLAGGKIGHYLVLDSTGRDISAELDVIVVAANPKITISSLTALSNLKVVFVGTTAGGL